jgi:hypothetical protein
LHPTISVAISSAEEASAAANRRSSISPKAQARFAFSQRGLSLMLAGLVPKDLDVPTPAAGHRHSEARSPKPPAVLANVPTFINTPPQNVGLFHFMFGNMRSLILRSKKQRAMLADRFLRTPSDQSLRATVPPRDDPNRIKRDDRKIFRTLDNLPVALFALTNGGFGTSPADNDAGRPHHEIDDFEIRFTGSRGSR